MNVTRNIHTNTLTLTHSLTLTHTITLTHSPTPSPTHSLNHQLSLPRPVSSIHCCLDWLVAAISDCHVTLYRQTDLHPMSPHGRPIIPCKVLSLSFNQRPMGHAAQVCVETKSKQLMFYRLTTKGMCVCVCERERERERARGLALTILPISIPA